MHVYLIAHTPEPERVIASAARLCYSSVGIKDITSSISPEKVAELIEMLKKAGHLSVFEHASFTFGIEGISRACSHQLVRHRIASFSQQSQRYVRYSRDAGYVIPPSVARDEAAKKIFASSWEASYSAYQSLLEAGVPQEDARYVLPSAAFTNIVVTMNARELLHFFELRCCNRAQWEIRETARRMAIIARKVCPNVFRDAGPSCFYGPCKEGGFKCERPPSKEEFYREDFDS